MNSWDYMEKMDSTHFLTLLQKKTLRNKISPLVYSFVPNPNTTFYIHNHTFHRRTEKLPDYHRRPC